LILEFCFTMALDYYFASFFLFPWPINFSHTSQGAKFSTHSSPSWFWSKIFSFFWIHSFTYDYVIWASSYTNDRRTTMGVICKFDIDLTPS
jgi:hypothetical protein